MSSSGFDETIRKFTEMMVDKIKQVGTDWEKPWFTPSCTGVPQNLSGRHYKGINSVVLTMEMENKGYQTPVFMTATQASMEHVKILKHERPIEVIYWNHDVYEKNTGKKIPYEEYEKLDRDKQQNYIIQSDMKTHNVYNIQQTEYPKLYPEIWENIKNKFMIRNLTDEKGMFKSPLLDTLINNQKWICPIKTEIGDNVLYSTKNKLIIIPPKNQFIKGEEFYISLLHEMAHSTGDIDHLSRDLSTVFGSPQYAKEELIAELTSAVCGIELGIYPNIKEDNAMYLKGWLNSITESPEYLFSILAEVGKASFMIKEKIMDMKQYMSIEDRFMNAAIQADKKELTQLKEIGYNPTLREIETLNKCTKDQATVKTLKETFNIDLNPEFLKTEKNNLNRQNYMNMSNGLSF